MSRVKMITVNGTCPFCKQMVVLQVNEEQEYSAHDLEELARMTCTCSVYQGKGGRVIVEQKEVFVEKE